MKALIHQGVILTRSDSEVQFGGPWGELQKSGEAVWLEFPAGENPDDCELVGGVLVVNPVKKAARDAAVARRNRIKTYDTTNAGLPELKDIVRDILDELKG